MKYYLSQSFLEQHKKEPLRRLIRLAILLGFVLLFGVFLLITSTAKNILPFIITFVGIALVLIFNLKDDFLIVFKFKGYKPPNYTIEISDKKITWVGDWHSCNLDLNTVEKVKFYQKKKKLKHIELITQDKSIIIILDEIDYLDLLLEELKTIIGQDKVHKTRFSQY